MKIGILSDSHLGHKRFYEEGLKQLEDALEKLSDAELIIHAGDVFDRATPDMKTLLEAYSIFRCSKSPVLIITGNHEKTAEGLPDGVEFLDKVGAVKHIGNRVELIESGDKEERIAILGMNYVNEGLAEQHLQELVEKHREELEKAETKILVIHQTIKDYFPGEGMRKAFIEQFGFDLVISGHIHKQVEDLPFLLPGSTLTTKIDEVEIEPRAAFLYDTRTKTLEKRVLEQRPFFLIDKEVKDGTPTQIREEVEKEYKRIKEEHPDAIVRIRIKGNLKEDVEGDIVTLPSFKDLKVDNFLAHKSIEDRVVEWKSQIEESRSIMAELDKELVKELMRIAGKDGEELYLLLREGQGEKVVEKLLLSSLLSGESEDGVEKAKKS